MASLSVSKADVDALPTSPRPAPELWKRCAVEGLERLRAVLERTDPGDVPLRTFLVLVIDRTGSPAQAFSAPEADAPPPAHLLGAFKSGLGEGQLRRDLALYFAEEVADCFGRLLAWKAGKAASEEERRRLEELARAQSRLLDGIRKVVLPPSDPPSGDSTRDPR